MACPNKSLRCGEATMNYIAVEGPIGVGKTTLANRLLADLGATLLPELPDENPFLGAFYDDPARYALPVQLSFLVQRARQVDSIRQGDLFSERIVADFLFDKDRLFAKLNLAAREYELYESIFERFAWQAPQPDRVIYLHAPVEVLMQRVRQRGREAEKAIEADYLNTVCDSYAEFFTTYDAAPLVVVDAAQLDLKNNPTDYRQLLEAISTPVKRIELPPRRDELWSVV